MKGLTQDMAADIYVDDYIVKPGFLEFASISPAITHKLVDAGVNTGTARPSKWLQESLNDLSRGGKDYPKIQVDGKVGAGTLNAYKIPAGAIIGILAAARREIFAWFAS